MADLQSLLREKQELEQRIAAVQREERGLAISKIRELMAQYGLTVEDLGKSMAAPNRPAVNKGVKVAPKYRDPETGDSWSGRGLKPKWLQARLKEGRALEDFRV